MAENKQKYTVLPNTLFYKNLPIEAIGLMAYFYSLNYGCSLSKTELQMQFNLSRNSLRHYLKLLQESGLLSPLNITFTD